MNRLMKLATAAFILSIFLFSVGNSPAPVAAVETAEFDPSVVENATATYEITDLETASGATTAKVALGGGPKEFGNSTPVSLGGHYVPVEKPGASWADLSTYRNVITLGEGYTFEVKVDTQTADYEKDNPGTDPLIMAAEYLPTNPSEFYANVFVHTMHTTLIKDASGKTVTTKTTGGDDVASFLDPQFTQALLLPVKVADNDTFYELGSGHPEWHWIGVSSFTTPDGTFGWWTLSYTAATSASTPLGLAGPYEVGWIATDVDTGIAQSMRIVNQQMLTWMSTSASGEGDPLVSFKVDLIKAPKLPGEEADTDDGPGFELGIALFTIATVAVVAKLYKRK